MAVKMVKALVPSCLVQVPVKPSGFMGPFGHAIRQRSLEDPGQLWVNQLGTSSLLRRLGAAPELIKLFKRVPLFQHTPKSSLLRRQRDSPEVSIGGLAY